MTDHRKSSRPSNVAIGDPLPQPHQYVGGHTTPGGPKAHGTSAGITTSLHNIGNPKYMTFGTDQLADDQGSNGRHNVTIHPFDRRRLAIRFGRQIGGTVGLRCRSRIESSTL